MKTPPHWETRNSPTLHKQDRISFTQRGYCFTDCPLIDIKKITAIVLYFNIIIYYRVPLTESVFCICE